MKLCQLQQQGLGPRGCQTKWNKSDRERQTSCEITHMWNLKIYRNELIYNKEIGSQTQKTHSVQSLSHVWLCATPWTAAHQPSLSITNSWSLLKLMSIESVMPSNHLILCCALLPPSVFSSIRVFSGESVLHIRWPKYWSFSFTISPSNEYSGLISFRMDWFNLLSVQGTLQESSPTPQFKSINSSTLSFLYGPTLTSIHDNWKTTALIRWTFVDKLMSLLFNMLSRLVITFLPRSKCLLISWLQSPSAVILEPKKIKPITVSTVSPSICPEVMGPDAMILVQKVNLMLLWEMGPLSCPG